MDNICDKYNISCPYALTDTTKEYASLPCIATQEQCNNWRMYRKIIDQANDISKEEGLENITNNHEIREKEICEECEDSEE